MSSSKDNRRLQLAFLSVFGAPENRNPDQELVYEYLKQVCFAKRPILYAGPTGMIDMMQVASNEGRRTVFLDIENMIRLAQHSHQTVTSARS